MKTYLLTVALTAGLLQAQAQDESKYLAAMQRNVATLDSAKNIETLEALVGNFERIATVEKTKWLPYYYAGYCAMRLSYLQKDLNKIDEKADKAEELIAKADELSPNNSEVSCLKAQVAFARINVDFMSRGAKYSQLANEYLLQAQKQNPANPRAYLLLGQSKYSTPEAFGGDKRGGCQLIQHALKLFEQPAASPIDPHWGRPTAERLIGKCNSL